MTVSRRESLRNPYFVLPKFKVEKDASKGFRPNGPLLPTQQAVVDALQSPVQRTLVLKARQFYVTSIVCLWIAHRMLLEPSSARFVQVGHEDRACVEMNRKIRRALETLPKVLRPRFATCTASEIRLTKGSPGEEVTVQQFLAGGSSQGRGLGSQYQHFTETAFYRKGSSAVGDSDTAADQDVWSSMQATWSPGRRGRLVIESTANGPAGVFANLAKLAQTSPLWNFVFIPYFKTGKYTEPVPADFVPTSAEVDMLEQYGAQGLTLEHLVWRRTRFETAGYELTRFQREYPMNPLEPFLSSIGLWMPSDKMARLSGETNDSICPKAARLVIIEPPQRGRRYFLGGDPSGGTGNDLAVMTILRDDFRQVVRWQSSETSPDGQASEWASLAATYDALCCVERNRFSVVADTMATLGCRMWYPPNEGRGAKPGIWMQRGSGRANTKVDVCTYARMVITAGWVFAGPEGPWISCPVTVSQLAMLTEHEDGNIAAPEGMHDDHASAWMIAVFCGKGAQKRVDQTAASRRATEESIEDALRRIAGGKAQT